MSPRDRERYTYSCKLIIIQTVIITVYRERATENAVRRDEIHITDRETRTVHSARQCLSRERGAGRDRGEGDPSPDIQVPVLLCK